MRCFKLVEFVEVGGSEDEVVDIHKDGKDGEEESGNEMSFPANFNVDRLDIVQYALRPQPKAFRRPTAVERSAFVRIIFAPQGLFFSHSLLLPAVFTLDGKGVTAQVPRIVRIPERVLAKKILVLRSGTGHVAHYSRYPTQASWCTS